MDNTFIGRQPIYDRSMRVVAYELLYRSGESNRAEFLDGDRATSEVLVNSFMDFGLEDLVGKSPAFVNLTRSFIVGDYPVPFSTRKIVLEVLENIPIDEAVIEGLRRLAGQGFIIALDDFQFHPSLEPLLELADIVKVDIMADGDDLERHVRKLRRYEVKLLAEKVESHAEFERCYALGFDYFQGYFFCVPNIIRKRSMSQNRLVLLSLLSELQDPEAELEKLETVIVQDAGLTVRLLRYINSASVGLPKEVGSIRQALMMIGTRTIRNWASLILLTGVTDKPRELATLSLVRAKMCEILAGQESGAKTEQAFTVGLLSLIDAFMDRPIPEVIVSLPLDQETKSAILQQGGQLGDILRSVISYERGEWGRLPDCEADRFRDAYVQAVEWAREVTQSLSEEPKAQTTA